MAACPRELTRNEKEGGERRLSWVDAQRYPTLSALQARIDQHNGSLQLGRVPDTGLMQLPEGVGELRGLKSLHIGGNRYLRSLPAGFFTLLELESLDLRNCGLPSLPEEVG